MARLSLPALFLSLLTLVNTTGALTVPFSLNKRKDEAVGGKWLAHDKIASFGQKADDTVDPALQLNLSPLYHGYSGCLPYAAVDAEGNHGAGLKPTGKSGGGCRDYDLPGQVYARTGTSNGRTGIMYSYYMPKIQHDGEDHRHYYLTVVVWVKDSPDCVAANAIPAAVSYYKGRNQFDTSGLATSYTTLNGAGGNTHPIIAYDGRLDMYPAQQGAEGARSPPLIGWTALTDAARDQLNNMKYEHTKCPFNEANFQTVLDSAYSPAYYTDQPASCSGRSSGPDTPTPTKPDEPTRTDGPDPASMPTGTEGTGDPDSFVDEEESLQDPSEKGEPDGVIPEEPSNTPTPDAKARRV